MAGNGGKTYDFYEVLGLKKECTEAELRNAYKKLALRWHPDRCSASGNAMYIEEAKKKFQAIQEAYSVLSDENKRFLYDVGVYDSDDDDNGMADFLNEMAVMMTQNKPSENGEESFEELKDLFQEMFQSDLESFGSSSQTGSSTSYSSSSLFSSCGESSMASNKRASSERSNNTKVEHSSGFDAPFQEFCLGADNLKDTRSGTGRGAAGGYHREKGGSRRSTKQKTSQDGGVASNYGIPA